MRRISWNSPQLLRFSSCRQHFLLTNSLRRNFTCTSARLHEYDWDKMARKDKDKEKAPAFNLKTPKGTKDWQGTDMVLREWIFNTITTVFKKHGAVTIDTPVFELKEILAGKYGEDSKLIYDLADQGGELCSLRYDLTVPFARWLAANSSIQNIKRYHIAKVYRRDQPAMTKGRMREFYQCDIDFAGVYDAMLPDAEILKVTVEIFTALGWKDKFTIKINHRKILDGLFKVCGVSEKLIRPISSAVDKLDKSPWDEVKKEMLEKGLDDATADKIGEYVKLKGLRDVLDKLKADPLAENEDGKKGIADMELMFDYLDAFGILEYLSFDLSLARGLDYYTGCIWEVVVEESAAPASSEPAVTNGTVVKKERSKKDKKLTEDDDRSDDPTVGVGSVAAGGRYDELVGMFSGKGQIPCVGISFGVDRIFSVIKKRLEKEPMQLRSTDVDVYVMAFGSGLLKERMALAKELWDAGIKAEFSWKVKPKMDRQFKDAEKGGIPLGIILGEDELAKGEVRIKQFGLAEGHAEKNGVLVQKSTIIEEIKKRLEGMEDNSLTARLGGIKLT